MFPTYYADVRAMTEQVMVAKGLTPEQIQAALDKEKGMLTPMGSSMAGFIGTVCTGLLAALIASAMIRSRGTSMA